MKGKIIAVVGAPRSGKSFLVKKLAQHFKAETFLEGEEGEFPARIEEDIKNNIRPLERVLWFRTMLVERYLKAMELRDQGKIVILDVFWMSPQMFIDVLLEGFERDLMWQVGKQDQKLLGWPDLTVFLKVNEASIRKFIAIGGRDFDNSEEFIKNQALPVNQMHIDFFEKENAKNILAIERDSLDFEKEEDLKSIITKIENGLE